MNWNGQREILDHLIAKRENPEQATALQTQFNQRRRQFVQKSLNVRPVYHPLKFEMNAAGQTSPYRDTTESLAYDTLIIGAKSDVQTREIIIRRTEDEKPIVYVGDEIDLNLRSDEIAGLTATVGGGQLGVFYFPAPIQLPRGNRLTIEMFKTDATADPETANIVLIGVRVYEKRFGELLLDVDEQHRIDEIIQLRDSPRIVYLKQIVEFDSAVAGGEARNIFTPTVEEPLLIRGCRTTLRQSTIEMRIQGEPEWTVKATPIWAIAGEDELIFENYQWFSRPVYLHSRNGIEITRVINGGIDGVNIDPQFDNTITWIAQTV